MPETRLKRIAIRKFKNLPRQLVSRWIELEGEYAECKRAVSIFRGTAMKLT